MSIPTQICSKCHEDFMNCKCEQFHPNIPAPHKHDWIKIETEEDICKICGESYYAEYEFTIEELRALYKLLEHHYIPYEDQEAHDVVNKIVKILKENESVSRSKSI